MLDKRAVDLGFVECGKTAERRAQRGHPGSLREFCVTRCCFVVLGGAIGPIPVGRDRHQRAALTLPTS